MGETPFCPMHGEVRPYVRPSPDYVAESGCVCPILPPLDFGPSKVERPGWDEYFLGIATAVAARGECVRSQVGAVLVKDRRIRASGYNGAPAGEPSCLTGDCPRATSGVTPGSSYDTGAGACIALHAEQNCLLFASRDDTEGGTLYVTREPCGGCWRMLLGSGLARVVWPQGAKEF